MFQTPVEMHQACMYKCHRTLTCKKQIPTEKTRVLATFSEISDNNNEPWHGISNNVVCATSKASDQPAHTRPSLHTSESQIVGNLMPRHINLFYYLVQQWRRCYLTVNVWCSMYEVPDGV